MTRPLRSRRAEASVALDAKRPTRRRYRYGVLLAVGILGAAAAVAEIPVGVAGAANTLTNISFAPNTTGLGTATTYNYTFTTASGSDLTAATFSLPSGTTGTPAIASLSGWAGYAVTLGSPAVTRSGTTLDMTFTSPGGYVNPGTQFAVSFSGLTNPSSAASVTSTISTLSGTTTVDSGTAATVVFTATAATASFWNPSSTTTAATGVSESFGLTTASTSALSSLSVILPPGVSGTPTVTTASPSTISGGTASLSGQVLTYTFTSGTIASGTVLSVTVGGLTNPSTGDPYGSVVTASSGATAVDAGAVAPVNFASTVLQSLSFSASSTTTSVASTSYTYGFTLETGQSYSSFVFALPPGTIGTPSLGTLAFTPSYLTLASASVAITNNQLVVSFASAYYPSGAVVSIQVNGITNTPDAGSFAESVGALLTGTPPVNTAVLPAATFTGVGLGSLSWSPSSTGINATAVNYTFGFSLSGEATLTSVTATVPPGTGGTPSVGTVTPPAIAGGSVSLSGTTLTYTFASATLASGTVLSIGVNGLTNTSVASTYSSSVTAFNASVAVASGTTPSVTFTSTNLTSLSWTASPTATSATDAAYTFGFTTASAQYLTSFTMTVPSGTGGTPTLGTTSIYSTSQGTQKLVAPTIALSGTTITVSFSSLYTASSTEISITINGLTNTSSAGTYTSTITTKDVSVSVDSGASPGLTFSATTLETPTWTTSTTAVGASGVSYTFSFVTSAATQLTSVSMTVPSGTGGTPSLGAVQPASIAGGSTPSLTGTTLTYSFASANIPAATEISIEINGLTNTTVASSYYSTVTVANQGTPVASGSFGPLSFTATNLSSLSWTTNSTVIGATGTSYSYGFTTATTQPLTGVTISVPSGTGGTPTISASSADQPSQGVVNLTSTSVSLSGSTLTVTWASVQVDIGTIFQITIGGLTNTALLGTYTGAVATRYGAEAVDSGTTPSVSMYAPYVTVTLPQSLTWSSAVGTHTSSIADALASDEGYSVIDATSADAGWHVSVAATTFTSGTHSLANAGTFAVNGSLSSATSATAPSESCLTICTTPVNDVTYPVQVTTAASSPAAVEIFSASANSGQGSFTIGGSTATAPVGWWVNIPANSYAGTYTSTLTFSVSSGP